jgi:hypothetical protein
MGGLARYCCPPERNCRRGGQAEVSVRGFEVDEEVQTAYTGEELESSEMVNCEQVSSLERLVFGVEWGMCGFRMGDLSHIKRRKGALGGDRS